MKKFILLSAAVSFVSAQAQFSIHIDVPADFKPKEAYVYTLDGSRDILDSKVNRNGNSWNIKIAKPYTGMMKVYFPETNSSLNLISENKDVKAKIQTTGDRISQVDYLDSANALMSSIQEMQQKKEYILPALYQIKEYYPQSADFGGALDQEISRLSQPVPNAGEHPFISYYTTNYDRFLTKDATKQPVTEKDIVNFLSKSNELLETSSLLRPILVSYLNLASAASKDNVAPAIDNLLAAVDTQTGRGQTVLSELIDIFDLYSMDDLKTRYLAEAKNLKCSINTRLTSTIASNVNTEIGAKFPNNKFVSPVNTKAKSLYDIKAAKKIIIFWSSTCSHCEKEIPEILAKYEALKKQNVEVVGLSLDADKSSYLARVNSLPWINDSELKGWYSSYADTYNVHATPTYFVLDADNKIIAKPDHAKDVIAYFKL